MNIHSIIYNSQKDRNHSNVHQCINGETYLYVQAMEYYPTLKKNKISIHTVIWMNLENIMLNEIN